MEAQPIQEYSSHQNSPNLSHSLENLNLHDQDAQFSQYLQALISRGLPIFVFQESSPIEQLNPQNNFIDQKSQYMNQRILTYSRKAKSLEELSKKFIQHFEGKENNLIQLDKVTVLLGVQRRRIYDVINILQSLNVVTKKGKNNYEWKGLCEAVRTINNCIQQGDDYKIQNCKKEKSLQYLAAGFLKLFISWKPAISLEQAAKQMMKQLDDASIKTKIRRLYDIINVFRSLGLVKKTSLPSKKPGYEWAGTEFLQHLIIKKQYCDENTGLNELNNEEDLPIPQEKTSSLSNTKNTVFSPFICPQLPKLNIGNFKLINDTKQSNDIKEQQTASRYINQQLFSGTHQFPIFRKTTSAFSLVSDGRKQSI